MYCVFKRFLISLNLRRRKLRSVSEDSLATVSFIQLAWMLVQLNLRRRKLRIANHYHSFNWHGCLFGWTYDVASYESPIIFIHSTDKADGSAHVAVKRVQLQTKRTRTSRCCRTAARRRIAGGIRTHDLLLATQKRYVHWNVHIHTCIIYIYISTKTLNRRIFYDNINAAVVHAVVKGLAPGANPTTSEFTTTTPALC
jgi:hypothetical protein